MLDIVLHIIFPASLLFFIAGTVYKILKVAFAPPMRMSHMPAKKISITHRLLLPFKKWIGAAKEAFRIDAIHAFGSFLSHIPLLIVIFLFAAHQTVIFDLLPFLEPILKPFVIVQQWNEAFITDTTIWGPLDVILNADLMAILASIGFIILLFNRIIKHLLKEFRSDLGDYIAIIFTLFILISGYLATHIHGTPYYDTMLSLHILSVAILLVYMPFSKFFHFIFYYWFNLVVYIVHKMRRGA